MTAAVKTRKSLEPFLKDDVEYYDHQITGIRTLARMKNFLLADDMGLGKSLQALTVFAMDVKMGRATTLLIVCPVTLRENWADEIEKFTRMPYVLFGERMVHGKPKKLSPNVRDSQLQDFINGVGPRILISNYEQIASKAHSASFGSFSFDAIIFDEAHYIKNPESARSKAALGLWSRRSFLLTGTPVLNQVNELWPILHRIDPARWPRYYSFRNRYCVFGGYKDKQIIGTKNESELIKALGEVMVRRVKKDVLTIPEPHITRVTVGLSDTQRKLYDEVVDDLRLGEEDVDNALIKFLRLKQICGTPACIGWPAPPTLPDDSLKLDRVVEMVAEFNSRGEKVVIFTQFRGIISALSRRLTQTHSTVPEFQLHGDVDTNLRVPLVKQWGNVRGAANLICQTNVAGIGLNMTQASICIFVDKLFVPGLNQQAIDRLYRIGASETQAVQVFEMICRGTVEARVEQILRSKSKLFGEIVEGGVGMRRLLEQLTRMELEEQ